MTICLPPKPILFFRFGLALFYIFPSYTCNANGSFSPIYAKGYFGEPLATLTASQKRQFERGFQLFAKTWTQPNTNAFNASSCVTCHSVPAPGGAGMSASALVPVRDNIGKTEVLHRYSPKSSPPPVVASNNVRRTPSLFGLGLLERAAPVDKEGNLKPIFGAFAEHTSLELVVARAFAIELGVSSSLHCARQQGDGPYPTDCSANISDQELADVTAFVRYLAAPPKNFQATPQQGSKLFESIGCSTCHQPSLVTRNETKPPFHSVRFYAYTDLKLHDLGGEVLLRTAPLWGVNSFGPPYLHNAKADTIESAIQQHFGEAYRSRELYLNLSATDRSLLLQFLRGL